MALNSWQKITRVLPGLPFGDGSSGALTISSNTTQSPIDETCTGTSGTTTITAGGTSLLNGHVVMIYQTYGSGEGQWEINRVVSGGGTSTLTMQENLQYTYASGAQIIQIPMYSNLTVNSGVTWTGKTHSSGVGSVLLFAVKGVFTCTGSLSADSIGLAGGSGVQYSSNNDGSAGGGSGGTSVANQVTANGSGGGGADLRQGSEAGTSGGGGGGNASAGSNGNATDFTVAGQYGRGGNQVGGSDLTDLGCPGAGGGGSYKGSGSAGSGGRASGSIVVFAKNMTEATAISADGANGGSSSSNDFASGAGGGAGGNILIQAGVLAIGTNKLGCTAGSGGSGSGSDAGHSSSGGTASKGRIALHYGVSLSGSVSSTFYGSYSATNDGTLNEFGGGSLVTML